MSYLTKEHQQKIIGEFIYRKKIGECIFIYLDMFIDIVRMYQHDWIKTNGSEGIWSILEASYKDIQRHVRRRKFLTYETVGEYLVTNHIF